jgi:hypothetical protein
VIPAPRGQRTLAALCTLNLSGREVVGRRRASSARYFSVARAGLGRALPASLPPECLARKVLYPILRRPARALPCSTRPCLRAL